MEYQWYAVYTLSRFEKKISTQIQEMGIECYLPLNKVLRQWKDRKKWVEEPLLRSYVFVKVSQKEYYEIFKVEGVVRYVCFSGKAVPIKESQIETLKIISSNKIPVVVLEKNNIPPGQPIKIVSGLFTGFEGEMVKYMGKNKILVRIEQIGRILSVNLPIDQIEIAEKSTEK